ncbi:hypothetical protein KC19_6G060700 [Ceratodon purpureus]|uniref:Uncharacterized protein n=1 Tax=Ceratodon purpureus TaxID=3225 RepID=A0A8T0HCN4_CERPU|nr:hypothetical protein KC19_6G060700 [Ceratodon purpureus]
MNPLQVLQACMLLHALTFSCRIDLRELVHNYAVFCILESICVRSNRPLQQDY